MKNEPKFLYRYYRFDEYTERIFTENKIFFQKPSKFNDPFDSKICLYDGTEEEQQLFFKKNLPLMKPELTSRRINEISMNPSERKKLFDVVRDMTDKRRDELGVYCLTTLKDNILMWSHYSDGHKGFCLEFDAQDEFFQKAQPIKSYSKARPVFNLSKIEIGNPHKWARELVDILLTKPKDWEYEDEWRIVFTPNDVGPGEYVFPEKSLIGIIFGSQMIDEDQKNNIIEWCGCRKFKPKFYQAKLKEREYGLDVIPLK